MIERLFRGTFEAAVERGRAEGRADVAQAVAHYAETQAGATRPAANPDATAAVELAASLYEAAFSVAVWSPAAARLAPLSPPVLAMIARELVTRGEAVLLIRTAGGRVSLLPASGWALTGNTPDPRSWRYELTLSGPTGARTATYSGAAVLHFRRGATLAEPWRGCAPVTRAPLTARLLAEVESQMGDEASGARGYLVPIPMPTPRTGRTTTGKHRQTSSGPILAS